MPTKFYELYFVVVNEASENIFPNRGFTTQDIIVTENGNDSLKIKYN